MRFVILVLRPMVLAALVLAQVACFGVRRQTARNHPPDPLPKELAAGAAKSGQILAEGDDDAREAQTRQRSLEWFNKRHPDGGLRAKAIEQKRRVLKAAAATSGQWTAIGPQPISGSAAYSGRVWGIGIDPRNSSVIYIGTDGGGVWKSTDAGSNWTPLTDAQANINIRDLTLAPSDPDTILAATWGNGILKSTDEGATWATLLPGTYVASVAVHPTNASIILAASGTLNRSDDGGSTWTTPQLFDYVLQVVFDPTDGNVAYATGMEQGLYRSADSGVTWSPVAGKGLPAGPFAYAAVAIAPSSTNILYLALQGSDGSTIGFYRSADSGGTWTQLGVPPNDSITYWSWSLRVHPTDPNTVYAGCLRLSRSTDGGKTWLNTDTGLHVDQHAQVYSADGNTLYAGNDGGIWSTTTPIAATPTWTNLNSTLNTAMFYPGISIFPKSLGTGLGGTQDNGILRYFGSLPWTYIGCGDGGFTAIDFNQGSNVYVSCAYILPYTVLYASHNGGYSFQAAQAGIGQDPAVFIPPLVMDPSNINRLYFGTNRVYQTLNGAGSWTPISNFYTSLSSYDLISSITVAPSDPNTVYVGMDGGEVFTTRNALSGTSATWTATAPFSGGVNQVAVDPQNSLVAWAGAVYATSSTTDGPIFRTADGAATWTQLGHGLPSLPVNDVLVDPDIANTVYVANDIGVYRTVDNGQSWLPLGTGLPNVIVHSLLLEPTTRTLRAATYGRGMWDLPVPDTGQVAVTIASEVAGAPFSLEDVTVYQAPVSFYWYVGASHTITWLSTAAISPGTRYSFQGWADGVSQSARTISVPSVASTYTGNMTVQYLLSVTSSGPAAAGTYSVTPTSTDGYYNSDATVVINATANPGYQVAYVEGYLTSGFPQSITMNAPHYAQIEFSCQYLYLYLPSELGPGTTQAYFQIQAGAGCPWSVSSSAPWLTVTSAASGVGTTAPSYSAASNTGLSRQAVLTVTQDQGQTYYTTVTQDSGTGGLPSVLSLTPNAGAGITQSFTLQAYGPKGYGSINSVTLEFFDGYHEPAPCEVYLDLSSSTPLLKLLNDNTGSYLGPVKVPGPESLQNSECIEDASKSSVSGSGNILTATFSLIFKPAFAGVQPVAAAATGTGLSRAGLAPEMVGLWTVPAGATLTISPDPIVLTDGSSAGTATITYSAKTPVNVFANQTLFCGGNTGGTCAIGKWVTNGMTFTVKDVASGATLASAKARVVSRPTTPGGRRK